MACCDAALQIKALGNAVGEVMEKIEHAKASIRANVEHPFHVKRTCSNTAKLATKGLL
ncbi:MAG: hypothetical protein ABIR84_02460 [Candidatus Nitrotoga sp.]